MSSSSATPVGVRWISSSLFAFTDCTICNTKMKHPLRTLLLTTGLVELPVLAQSFATQQTRRTPPHTTTTTRLYMYTRDDAACLLARRPRHPLVFVSVCVMLALHEAAAAAAQCLLLNILLLLLRCAWRAACQVRDLP